METLIRSTFQFCIFLIASTSFPSLFRSTNLHQQLPRVLVPRIESSVSVGVGVGGGGGGTTLGDLLGQEQLAGTSQTLCHYRRNSSGGILPSVESANNGQQQSAQPISLVCQLGCCPTGLEDGKNGKISKYEFIVSKEKNIKY
jgi:hypothetical protein